MGKYERYQQKKQAKREINPIWRGVGCLLIILVPLLSYGLMLVSTPPILATGLVPYQLLGFVHFPDWAFRFKMTSDIALFIGSINNLWFSIIIFLLILLILTAIISIFYSVMYQAVGPARYTPQDAPPSKYKPKKYTR